MATEERRRSARHPARVQVDYEHEGTYLISYTRDISPDGIFLHTPRPLPVGSRVKLVFRVAGLHEVVVTGMVMWTPTPGSIAEPGMGLQFVELPDSLRKALLEIVHRIAVLPETDADTSLRGTA